MFGRVAKKPVWILVAWVALAVQAAPSAWCRGCELPCCAVAVHESVGGLPHVGGEPAGGCPLCSSTPTAADSCPVDATDQPCHCQLDARQDQPISPPRGISSAAELSAQTALSAAVVRDVPQAVGISREYLAASLAVPIRPLRILFGVWRN
jgi:hypothetical protein